MRRSLGALMLAAALLAGCASQPAARPDPTPLIANATPAPTTVTARPDATPLIVYATPRLTPIPTPRLTPKPRPAPPPSLDHYNALVTLINNFNAELKRDLAGSPIRWSTLQADADGFQVSLILQPDESCYLDALMDLQHAAHDLTFAGLFGDMPGGSVANENLQSGLDSFVRGKWELSIEGDRCATEGG